MKRVTSLFVLFSFLVHCIASPYGFAQTLMMPQPGGMVPLSAKFEPALMVGIQVNAKDPFKLNFIMDKGEEALSEDAQKQEFSKVVKYFLASLTVPNKDMWVNLSPYEHNRILPEVFGKTGMGRDLLAQDYLLKQITASAIYPGSDAGKEFWRQVYRKVFEQYGTTNVPVDTFNKVWIVPDKAVVYEKDGTAIVMESRLKVMLEQDYLALDQHRARDRSGDGPAMAQSAGLSSDIVRSVVVPLLEKEVNEGKNFAPLRQIYSGMLMATYFKKTLKQSILGQIYADKGKTTGVDIKAPKREKERIYQRYMEAYKKGAFNYIREEADPGTREIIPRKYFSGGAAPFKVEGIEVVKVVDNGMLSRKGFAVFGNFQKWLRLLLVSVALSAPGQGVVSPSKANAGEVGNMADSTSKNFLPKDAMVEMKRLVAEGYKIEGISQQYLNHKIRGLGLTILFINSFPGAWTIWISEDERKVRMQLAPSFELTTNMPGPNWEKAHKTTIISGLSFVIPDLLRARFRNYKDTEDLFSAVLPQPSGSYTAVIVETDRTTVTKFTIYVISTDEKWTVLPNGVRMSPHHHSGYRYFYDITSKTWWRQPVLQRPREASREEIPESWVPEDVRNELIVEMSAADKAAATTTGGIDLNDANLNMQIRRDGRGMPLPLALQDHAMLGVTGLVPVIISITPLGVFHLPALTELESALNSL